MINTNIDIIKLFNSTKGASSESIDNIINGLIIKQYGEVEYIEDIDVLETYRTSLRKLMSLLRLEYYKCKVDVNAFLDKSDESSTRGVPININGIPSNAYMQYTLDTSDIRELTLSIIDIIEIQLKGYDFKLSSYKDIPRLYRNIKDFLNGYEEMINTSYNAILINQDIISEFVNLMSVIEERYFNVIKYDIDARRMEEYRRKFKSGSIVEQLEVLNYELKKASPNEFVRTNMSDEEKDDLLAQLSRSSFLD